MKRILFVFSTLLAIILISADDCPNIKTRKKWGGAQPTAVDYQVIPVKYVILHHTATPKCSNYQDCADRVKNIQDYHMQQLGWHDIGYNFLIGNDGNVYEGVGWHKIGAHAIGYNSKSIGVVFIGDFSNELPSASALAAAKNLLSCGVEKGELDRRYKLLGARQVHSTISPGLTLYNEIQEWDNWSSRA